MEVWLAVKNLPESDALKMLAEHCSGQQAFDGRMVVETYALAGWTLCKVYLSDSCFDSIYPEDCLAQGKHIEEAFIVRMLGDTTSSQILEVYRCGAMKLKLDLMNQESVFLEPYDMFSSDFGDIDAIRARDDSKPDDERSEMQALLARLFPELNPINASSIWGIFSGLFDEQKGQHIFSAGGFLVPDSRLQGYEDNEIELEGETLYLWGG